MEKIEKDYGCVVMQDGKVFDFEGGYTGNGVVFKDYEAFKAGKGICYISEHALVELNSDLTELECRYENITNPEDEDFLPDEEYEEDRASILAECGETRQSIINQVREAFGDEYLLTDEQVEYFAENVFELADWAYISTYLTENFGIEDCIEYDHIKGNGKFTKFQYEAVMAGQTPKEYADRQLSYGELAELDSEFDGAFLVDEDCIDDWSDKGLGANARLTYVEERRTGLIDGPEDFDCPEKFRK